MKILLIPVIYFATAMPATAQIKDSVYSITDKPASFTAGNPQEFLMTHTNYPQAAIDSNIQGGVVVRFIVDKKGVVRNPNIIRSVHPLLDRATLLSVINMPYWRPAEMNGEKVNSYVTLTLPFEIILDTTTAAPPKSANTEKMPEFPGGQDRLLEYLKRNIKYPFDALSKHIEGKVQVRFVIDEEGKISEPVVVHPVYPSLDKEAIRVVMHMLPWHPGEQNGKKVKVYFTVPVSFRLEN
jgi:TonB family protein